MGYPLSTPPSRAPRWAGSTSDEYITYFMASSKPSKRPYPDSDSDSEPLPSTFPHFIVLESLDEKQLTKPNPIIIEKTISGIVNPLSVKKLNNGTLLIEVDKKAYAENLLKMKTFAALKIKASPHLSQFFQGCSSELRTLSLHIGRDQNLSQTSRCFRCQTHFYQKK